MTIDAVRIVPWIVGPVTIDRFDDGRRVPGGAVLYAARVAESAALRARVLTVASPEADTAALQPHETVLLPTEHTLTFAHHLDGAHRRLAVEARPGRTLSAEDVPPTWGAPGVLILGPLLPEDIDIASFLDRWPETETALLAQGLQRRVDAEGAVTHLDAPSEALRDAARPNVTVFMSEEETSPWPAGALGDLARRAGRVVLTRGDHGALVMRAGETIEVPAQRVEAIDPTGAGDVFATAFILGVRAGDRAAGRLAAAMAAAAVTVRGPAPLPARATIESRLLASDVPGDAPGEGPPA